MHYSLFSFGNLKQDDGTAIFNFCASLDCPSEKLGLYLNPDVCYAKQPEKSWPNVRGHCLV